MISPETGQTGLPCTLCGSSNIRRSRRQSWLEVAKMALGVYPFRCLDCGARFRGNVWMRAAGRYAMCPKCVRFGVDLYPRRVSRLGFWQKLLTALGAHQYRCEPCRHNFVSFYARRPVEKARAAASG
jgi:DNA-directed RNA polymerase subunit RPC12/RpoP